jgi:hypothetical protein
MEETIATPVAAGAKGSPQAAAADGTILTVEELITTEDLKAVLVVEVQVEASMGLPWAVVPCREPDVASLLPEVIVQVIDEHHIGA